MSKSNWQEYLTKHFSHECYEGQNFTDKDMLDNYLATVDHGLQHGDGEVKFTNIEGMRYLQTTLSEETILISAEDLKNFGYVPESLQNAEDFISENWNWY